MSGLPFKSEMLKMKLHSLRVFLAILALSGVISVRANQVGAGSGLLSPGSYGMPSAPGPGYVGVHAEDNNVELIRPSTLRRFTVPEEGMPLCSGLTDSICAGKKMHVHAILPRCDGDVQTDCVQAVSARDDSGVERVGVFSQYFPTTAPSNFLGDPSAKIPSGSNPSIWKIPGVSHAGGTDFMAMVSIDGVVDESHRTFSGFYPSLRVALYPVALTPGRFEPWVPDPSGVSTSSQDQHGNCAALATGFCAARQDFPEQQAFSITLKLSSVPAGWLWGRLISPLVSYETNASGTSLKVEAKPALVPAVAVWAEASKVSSSMGLATCNVDQMCGYVHGWNNPNSIEDWRPFYRDKATWVRGQWGFMNAGGTSGSEGGGCFSDEKMFHGLVATDASYSNNGPPIYSAKEETFTYSVGSPHYDENDRVLQGFYSLLVRTATAKCLYGIKEGSVSALATVTKGPNQAESASVTKVVDDGTWLRVNVSGFHYSKPDIKVRLTSSRPDSVEPSVVASPSNTTPVTIPVLKPVATPATSQMKVKLSKAVAAKSIAAFAKLKVLSTSKVSLKVLPSSAKFCRVSGASLKGLKAGSCKVTVTVKPKKGKSVSKTITLKVAK